MGEIKRHRVTLLLAVAAIAVVFPAYALARWIWAWRQGRATFQQAVMAFETGFPLGLRGRTIAWVSVAAAAVGVLASGFASQRSHGPQRAIAYFLLVVAATLVMWNLWTMM